MPRLGTAYVAIKADRKPLKPGLDKARRTVKSSVDKMSAQISRLSFRALQVSAIAFSAAMVYNFKLAIDAASDLQEVTSKFETVFKGQEKAAESFSKNLVDSYGLSTRAAKEHLASVQDLLVPMGMQAIAAGRLSNEIVKLSVDLGSFNNQPTAAVMRDIQSALVGNFETMKKYGVVLNVAVVTQEALTSGLIKTKDELTAGLRAQAAYQLMVKGSEAAIGDWARTSESFANQMKQLKSNIEDFRAEIGKELLPLITPIVAGMNKWLEANKGLIGTEFKEWLEAVNPVFKVFAATASMLGQAAGGLGVLIAAFQSIGETTPGAMTEHEKRRLGLLGGEGGAIGGDQTAADTAQQEAIERSLAIDQEAKARYLELELTHSQTLLQQREAFNANMLRIDQARAKNAEIVAKGMHSLDKKMATAKLSLATAVGMAAFQIAGIDGKKMFAIQKATQVGMAVMSAFMASNLALATFPGPPFTIPLAAATLKLGLFNAAAIAATAIGSLAGGGGVGGGLGGGGTAISPTITAPAQTTALVEDTIAAETRRGTLNIFIEGDFIGDEVWIDNLVEKINAADDRDVFINKANIAIELET